MIATYNQQMTGEFLGENLEDFPFAPDEFMGRHTALFVNKGITGCGGTTLVADTAIRNGFCVVCLMPTVSAVQSKEEQFCGKVGVQALYGSRRLKGLAAACNVIFATYDKVSLIREALGEDTRRFFLVIDEYHTLTRDSFRHVMPKVVEKWDVWRSVTCLSATPDTFLEDSISTIYSTWNLQRLNLTWDYTQRVVIDETNCVKSACVELVNKFKTRTDLHLYLMLNNVSACQGIISACRLKSEQYHLLCSKSQQAANRSSINDLNTHLRPINFITAAGFEGTDIKDPRGVIVCVLDTRNNCTMFDWQTIVQLNGRCRGSVVVPHILYHTTNELRPDQVQDLTLRYEELNLKHKRRMKVSMSEVDKDPDYLIVNNKVVVSPFALSQIHRQKNTWENMMSVKKLTSYLESNGICVEYGGKIMRENNGKRKQTQSFKQQVKQFLSGNTQNLHDIGLIEAAVETIGEDRLRDMVLNKGCSKGSLKRLLESLSETDRDAKIRKCLGIAPGWYSCENVSARIKFCNETMGTEYDETKPLTILRELGMLCMAERKLINGKRANGIMMLHNHSSQTGCLTELKYYNKLSSISKPICETDKSSISDALSGITLSIADKPGVKNSHPRFVRATFSDLLALLERNKER